MGSNLIKSKSRLASRGRSGLSAAERRRTLQSVSAALRLKESIERHAYLAKPLNAPVKNRDLVLGYPDEHELMTSFIDSLAMYLSTGKWQIAFPLTLDRLAFVVDLTSRTETNAERLIQTGFSVDRESPYRIDEVFVEDSEVNAQNLRYKRNISLIATGVGELDYEQRVGNKLPRPDEPMRGSIRLSEAFRVFASAVKAETLHVFSIWEPSPQLLAQLSEHYIEVSWKPLSAIPKTVRTKIQYLHLWDGTRKQGLQFLRDVWNRS